jgi:hypothetical protein
MDVRDAYNRVGGLLRTLRGVTDTDPEQEVQGMALPVMDAVLKAARELLPSDPVVATIRDVISPEAITEGRPLRAVDALIVVEQLHAALGQALPPIRIKRPRY